MFLHIGREGDETSLAKHKQKKNCFRQPMINNVQSNEYSVLSTNDNFTDLDKEVTRLVYREEKKQEFKISRFISNTDKFPWYSTKSFGHEMLSDTLNLRTDEMCCIFLVNSFGRTNCLEISTKSNILSLD